MPKPSPRPAEASSLEAQLTDITREFVARIVTAIRSASFAEVAGLDTGQLSRQPSGPLSRQTSGPASSATTRRAQRSTAGPIGHDRGLTHQDSGTGASMLDSGQGRRGRRPRQTQEKRGELAERIVSALASAGAPLGVRALASNLSTAPDLLATPLRELRQQGRIRKLGEKRNTTYALE